jgi:hypothetical protein
MRFVQKNQRKHLKSNELFKFSLDERAPNEALKQGDDSRKPQKPLLSDSRVNWSYS